MWTETFNLSLLHIIDSLCYPTHGFTSCSWNHCHFLCHSCDTSCACETACRRLSLLPCKLSEQNLSFCVLSDFNGACPHVCFVCVLPAPPFLLVGVPLGLNLQQSQVFCDLYGPSCFLHRAQCLSLKPTCLDVWVCGSQLTPSCIYPQPLLV